jgi:hypothetical protein
MLFLAFQIFEDCRWINRVLGVSHLFEEEQESADGTNPGTG